MVKLLWEVKRGVGVLPEPDERGPTWVLHHLSLKQKLRQRWNSTYCY